MKSLLYKMNLVVPLNFYYQNCVEVLQRVTSPKDGDTSKSIVSPYTKHSPKGISPKERCIPYRENIPKISPKEKTSKT
jgi:hypothetical protein